VVVVGGGFGGLRVVKALRDAPVEATLSTVATSISSSL
jgi:NADH dehydrogenase FAD-containing subunit